MSEEVVELTITILSDSPAKAKLHALAVADEVNDELQLAEETKPLSPEHVRFHFYVPDTAGDGDGDTATPRLRMAT